MSNTMETILSHRTIRRFARRPVAEGQIEALLAVQCVLLPLL
ncbi:MAG: hypothetical protein AB1445_02115 [Bacillota bacterium]